MATLRRHARDHPPPGLIRLTEAERRELLGDAYLGDFGLSVPVAKHGTKGDPGYSLLHPGPQRPAAEEFSTNFKRLFRGDPFAAFVSHYSAAEIESRGMVPITINDGSTGVLVWDHDDGRIEAASLYNRSTTRGAGLALLRHVVRHDGVNYVECYGRGLEALYQTAGFATVKEYSFDDSQASADWDYQRFGRQSYKIMTLGGVQVDDIAKATSSDAGWDKERALTECLDRMLAEQGPEWMAENEGFVRTSFDATDVVY